MGKSRKGKDVVRQTMAKSRSARSLAAVKERCRTNRRRPVRHQRAWLSAVYYGVTGNIRRLQDYCHQVEWTSRKWLERRTRGMWFICDSFRALLTHHPPPAAKIIHRYTGWDESLA
jgi:hypothetical protein